MPWIRWKNEDDCIFLGEDCNDGTAWILEGDLENGFVRTETRQPVGALLAPLTPVNVFGIGLNYREHAQETSFEMSDYPTVFMKATSSLQHPGAPIRIPSVELRGPEVDFEGELAVIIGRTARNVPVERALEVVAGYTCANDISARRWQKHGGSGQWVRAKSFDTFCPLGPCMATVDEIPDPGCLLLETRLNGALVQSINTSQMIFSVAQIISFLSQDTTLLSGTVILTGTPAGVGYTRKPPVFLKAGDILEVTIGGIGTLRNPVVAHNER